MSYDLDSPDIHDMKWVDWFYCEGDPYQMGLDLGDLKPFALGHRWGYDWCVPLPPQSGPHGIGRSLAAVAIVDQLTAQLAEKRNLYTGFPRYRVVTHISTESETIKLPPFMRDPELFDWALDFMNEHDWPDTMQEIDSIARFLSKQQRQILQEWVDNTNEAEDDDSEQ